MSVHKPSQESGTKMFREKVSGRPHPLGLRANVLVAMLVLGGLTPDFGHGQELTATPDVTAVQAEYDQLVADWRASVKRVSEAMLRFKLSPQAESSDHRKVWLDQSQKTDEILARLKPAALRLYDATPEPSEELTNFMKRVARSAFDNGQYELARRLAERILKTKPDTPAMIFVRGRCCAFMNDFEEAKRFANENSAMLESIPEKEQLFFDVIDYAIEVYEKELALQKQEAAADDLPRVELKTSKGTILVELFENEAPNTVGNFIDLVEKGHFDEKAFHRVINGFMAQTGGYTSKAVFAPLDYTIYDEFGEPNARRHFRGVLSMAKGKDAHTGSGQFFITFVPCLFLDGKHTVFGRVLSGWDALEQLNRTFTSDENGKEVKIPGMFPDRMISARVIRKRDHEYKPDKFDINDE